MNRCDKLAILFVDDQPEALHTYSVALQRRLQHVVECASIPAEALLRVQQRLFDVVIVDAKIPYKGSALGGLLLAEEVARTTGIDAVVVISQYDVRDEVRLLNQPFAFVPKPADGSKILAWARNELLARVRVLVERQYGFVAMPFGDTTANARYRTVVAPAMAEAGFQARRMDEIATSRRPIDRDVLLQIEHAHLFVLDATHESTNAFFEAGCACALGKCLVILAPDPDRLPFDVRTRHAIVTADVDDRALRQRIAGFLTSLRD